MGSVEGQREDKKIVQHDPIEALRGSPFSIRSKNENINNIYYPIRRHLERRASEGSKYRSWMWRFLTASGTCSRHAIIDSPIDNDEEIPRTNNEKIYRDSGQREPPEQRVSAKSKPCAKCSNCPPSVTASNGDPTHCSLIVYLLITSKQRSACAYALPRVCLYLFQRHFGVANSVRERQSVCSTTSFELHVTVIRSNFFTQSHN